MTTFLLNIQKSSKKSNEIYNEWVKILDLREISEIAKTLKAFIVAVFSFEQLNQRYHRTWNSRLFKSITIE